MSSYVNKKTRAFKAVDDIEIKRKRSDGRMKTYQSATDARAWCDSTEERRQYILELIRQGDGKGLSLGKIIPIEAIIDILLANKNADIKQLQDEIEALRAFIKQHGLHYEEPKSVEGMSKAASGKSAYMGAKTSSGPGSIGVSSIVSGGHEAGEMSESQMSVATEQFLAGKSSEDQIAAVKDVLAEKQAQDEEILNLAVAAIQQLENIKDIVDDKKLDKDQKNLQIRTGRSKAESDSCKDEIDELEREINNLRLSSPQPEAQVIKKEIEVLKKYCAKLQAYQQENEELKRERDLFKGVTGETGPSDSMKVKIMKLEEVTEERDRLRARRLRLEQELKHYNSLPTQQVESADQLFDEVIDGKDLQDRFEHLKGLEDEVRALKTKADKCAELNSELDETRGDKNVANQELERLRCKCDEYTKNKETDKDKIKRLEKELDELKCKDKEAEILKCENNCLRRRLEDLDKMKKDYEELLKKTKDYDALKAECLKLKARCEELENLESELMELRAKVERAEELEKERELLLKEIMDCECCMASQEKEIKRLACHIDCLTQDLDRRQDEMKCKVVKMRAHIEQKDNLIARSEQKLADVQSQLRSSIDGLSCETSCLRNRIEELENETTQNEERLQEKDNRISELVEKMVELEKQISEANNELAELQKSRGKMEGDEHYKRMLKQTKCAIKCLCEKLKNYEIADGSDRLKAANYLKRIEELEQEVADLKAVLNQIKACGGDSEEIIDALNDKIKSLEAKLKAANKDNEGLRKSVGELSPIVDENKTLRRTSTELQESAKTQINRLESDNQILREQSKRFEELFNQVAGSDIEKDDLIAKLKKEIESLRGELEKERKLRQAAEAAQKVAKVEPAQAAPIEVASAPAAPIKVASASAAPIKVASASAAPIKVASASAAPIKVASASAAPIKVASSHAAPIKVASIGARPVETVPSKAGEDTSELARLRDQLKECQEKVQILSAAEDGNATEELLKLQDQLKQLELEKEKVEEMAQAARSQVPTEGPISPDTQTLEDELNRLKQENANLKEQVSSPGEAPEAGAKIQSLEMENKDLKDEINRLKQQLTTSQKTEEGNKTDNYAEEKETLLKQIDDKKKEISDLLNNVQTLELENKNLKDEINRLKQLATAQKPEEGDKTDNYAEEKETLLKQVDDKKKEIGNLLNNVQTLELENKNLKDEINRLKQLATAQKPEEGDKTDNYTEEKETLLKQIGDQKKEIGNLLNNVQTLELENKNLKDEINRLKQQLATAQKPEAGNKTDNCAEEKEALQKQIADQKKEIGDLLNKIKQPTSTDENVTYNELQKKNEENDQLKAMISDLERQLNDLKKAPKIDIPTGPVEDTVRELTTKLENDEKKIKDLENALKRCQESSGSGDLIKANENLKDRISELETINENLKIRIANLEATNENLKARITELEALLAKQGEAIPQPKQTSLPSDTQAAPAVPPPKRTSLLSDTQAAPTVPPPKRTSLLSNTQAAPTVPPPKRTSLSSDTKPASAASQPQKRPSAQQTLTIGSQKQGRSSRSSSLDKKPTPQSMDDCKERIKELEDALARTKRDCEENMASLKKQYERDLKQAQSENRNSIDILQKRQESAIRDINKKHESELLTVKEEVRDKNKKSVDTMGGILEERTDTSKKSIMKSDSGASEERKPRSLERDQSIGRRSPSQDEVKPRKIISKIKVTKEPPPGIKGKEETVSEVRPVKAGKVKGDSRGAEVKAAKPTVKSEKQPITKLPTREQEEDVKAQKAVSVKLPCTCGQPSAPSTPAGLKGPCICAHIPQMVPGTGICTARPQHLPQRQPQVQHIQPQVQHLQPQVQHLQPQFQQQLQPQMASQYAPVQEQPVLICGGHRPCPPQQMEKLVSIKKIAELENKLLTKQHQTKQKVEMLQTTVDSFKRELELERQKNNDLVNRYANQSKTVANMMLEMDLVKKESVLDKKKLSKLNSTLRTLEKDLNNERSVIQNLNTMLSDESRNTSEMCLGPCRVIPHFHTEVTRKNTSDNKYECVMKKPHSACPKMYSDSSKSPGTSKRFDLDH